MHTGELDCVAGDTAISLPGLMLAGVGVIGLLLWWQRRQARMRAGQRKQAGPVLSKL